MIRCSLTLLQLAARLNSLLWLLNRSTRSSRCRLLLDVTDFHQTLQSDGCGCARTAAAFISCVRLSSSGRLIYSPPALVITPSSFLSSRRPWRVSLCKRAASKLQKASAVFSPRRFKNFCPQVARWPYVTDNMGQCGTKVERTHHDPHRGDKGMLFTAGENCLLPALNCRGAAAK